MTEQPQPIADWKVRLRMTRCEPGQATVEMEVENPVFGCFGPVDLSVDWLPGMEPNDVEAHALILAATTLKALMEECAREAGRRMSAP